MKWIFSEIKYSAIMKICKEKKSLIKFNFRILKNWLSWKNNRTINLKSFDVFKNTQWINFLTVDKINN